MPALGRSSAKVEVSMPASIILNGEITLESCAVCQEPGIIIKHGRTESGSPAHYTMCPRCENDIVLVCYDCQWCQDIELDPNWPEREILGIFDEAA